MNLAEPTHLLRCACGTVECVGRGKPIGTAVCYCDDCLAAARLIEALPDAPPVADPDGGTALTLFHAKRFEVLRGADRLAAHKLRPESATSRMVAQCCNSAMYLAFNKGPYWVSVLRNRLEGELPPIEFRHMTRYRTSSLPFPDTSPRSLGFAPRFVARVLWKGIIGWFGKS